MPNTLDPKRLDEVFEAIEANDHKLTPWEIDFIENVKPLWERGVELSEKRMDVLERIYLKV